ncbi:HNH endonuclease [Microbacterium sp. ZW CA_36]|uniref:HNH endonuclease n=1 Tax=Microbacterium sp. ZW CA_36 TaxID=3378078 RepID=UPI0038533D26
MEPPFLVKTPEPRYFMEDHCANCLTNLPDAVVGPYCSTWCAEVSGHVRYMRAVLRDGRIEDPLVRTAIQTRGAFLLIGGYRSLGRTVSAARREEVKKRDAGLCQECGNPGTDIDHVSGSSDALGNLQLLCGDCHRAKTAEQMTEATPERVALLQALFLSRVAPDEPRLLADDETQWADVWKGLQAARKARFIARLDAAGIRGRSRSRIDLASDLAVSERQAERDLERAAEVRSAVGTDTFFDDLMRRV